MKIIKTNEGRTFSADFVNKVCVGQDESNTRRKYELASQISQLFDELMPLETHLSPFFKAKLEDGHYCIRNLLDIYAGKLGLHDQTPEG